MSDAPAELAAAGYRYLALSGDITLLGNAAKTLVAALHEASSTHQP